MRITYPTWPNAGFPRGSCAPNTKGAGRKNSKLKPPRKPFGRAIQNLRTVLAHVPRILQVRAFWLGVWLLCAALSCSLLYLQLQRLPVFSLKSLRFQGARRLSAQVLSQQGHLRLGMSLFERSPELIEQDLRRHPWIKNVRVKRQLPSTYVIEVEEYRPMAIFALERPYLVSAEGHLIKPLSEDDRLGYLPLVRGMDGALLVEEKERGTKKIYLTLSLIRSYRQLGIAKRLPLQEVHWDADGGLHLHLAPHGTHVKVGQAPYEKKLLYIEKVLNKLSHERKVANYVYIVERELFWRVVVKLAPSSEARTLRASQIHPVVRT
jgi:cell division protein FtsQ